MPNFSTFLDRFQRKYSKSPKSPKSSQPSNVSATPASTPTAEPTLTFDELFQRHQLPRLREQVAASGWGRDGVARVRADCEQPCAEHHGNPVSVMLDGREHQSPLGSNPTWVPVRDSRQILEGGGDGWIVCQVDLEGSNEEEDREKVESTEGKEEE